MVPVSVSDASVPFGCAGQILNCDREGQLIGQEILEHYNYRGQVMRVLFTEQDSRTIRDAFGHAKPNSEYARLYAAAVARRQADQISNTSLTRTANVILGVGFDVPGFAVDTHVKRLTNRIKLASSPDPVKIERQVCSIVPKEEWTGLSLRLILHGRRVCIARRPLCEECILNDFCPSSRTRPKPTRSRKAG